MGWYSESDFDSSVVKGDWTSEETVEAEMFDHNYDKEIAQHWYYYTKIYLSTARTKRNQIINKFSLYYWSPRAGGYYTSYKFSINSEEYSISIKVIDGHDDGPYVYIATFYYISEEKDVSSGTSLSYSYSIIGYTSKIENRSVSFTAPEEVVSIWVNVNYNTTETKADWRPAFIYVNENFEDEAATTDSWVEPTSIQWYVNSQWYEL